MAPEVPPERFSHADLLVRKGRYQEALQEYEAILRTDSANPKALAEKGLLFARWKNFHPAMECWKKVQDQCPGDPDILMIQAQALYYLDRFRDALKIFQDICTARNTRWDAFIWQGICLAELGKRDEALQAAKKGLEGNPADAQLLLLYGKVLALVEDYEKAIAYFQNSFKADTTLVEALLEQGRCFALMEKYDEASRCHDEARAIDEENTDIPVFWALSLHYLERYEEAIRCYDAVLPKTLGGALIPYDKGVSYLADERNAEAIACFSDALGIYPEYLNALTNKGVALYSLERYDEALKCYQSALTIDKEDPDILNNIGEIYYALQKYDEALEKFSSVTRSNPDHFFAWYNTGRINYEKGNYSEAVSAFDRALKIEPDDSDVLAYKGFALGNLDLIEEAKACFTRGLKADKNSAAADIGLRDIARHDELFNKNRRRQQKLIEYQNTLLEHSMRIETDNFDYLSKIQKSVIRGLDWAAYLIILQFFMSILLLLIALELSAAKFDTVVTALFTTGGVLAAVIAIINISPARLQKTKIDSSQWMIAYYTWYNTFYAANQFICQKMFQKQPMTWDEVEKIQTFLLKATTDTTKNMEDNCEPKEVWNISPFSRAKDTSADSSTEK